MRLYFITAAIGILAGGLSGFVGAGAYKPAPVTVKPTTTIVQRGAATSEPTKSQARVISASWGDLDQKEVDAITAAVRKIAPAPLTIFCKDDVYCGDMQLDFENAFESAQWKTKTEAPMIDDTFGIATSLPSLRDAINTATGGRLDVKLIEKSAPFEVLVIGKKPKA